MSDPTRRLSVEEARLLHEWKQQVFDNETQLGFDEWHKVNQPKEWKVAVSVTLRREIIVTAPNRGIAEQMVREAPELMGLDYPEPPEDVDCDDSDWSYIVTPA